MTPASVLLKYDHDFQMKEYKLNLRTKKCNVSNLDRPFRPFEVPPFAKFDFEAEVGPASMPGEHMTIQEWEAEFRTHGKVFIREQRLVVTTLEVTILVNAWISILVNAWISLY